MDDDVARAIRTLQRHQIIPTFIGLLKQEILEADDTMLKDLQVWITHGRVRKLRAWTTGRGDKYLLKDMTTDHLKNILRAGKRKHLIGGSRFSPQEQWLTLIRRELEFREILPLTESSKKERE